MVKADYKHDYYADLDLTSSADQETIKRRFRELAKQYHPDRNPGREVDVVPKFQAIQAAHEILGDAAQKDKYDLERAKIQNRARDVESPTFRKPAPPRRTDSGFPQTSAYAQTRSAPPRRDPSETRYTPQNAPRSRPTSANVSAGDKFAQFARAAPPPQTWDKARFEAEGLRGMNAMRGGQMPQTSPLRSHHPTAPKSADPYMSGGEPSPGFPGLNRTGSQRRNYAPSPAEDPRSTYSRYNRSDPRPPSTGPYQNTHSQPRRDQESVSPLRQSRSFNPSDFTHVRPGLSRTSSKYAHTGGERTAPNDANTGRSASTRYSPTDRDQGPFGQTRSPEERAPRPRRRSHSPPTGNQGPRFQYASESSSEGDDTPPPQDRKKASIRRAQTRIDSDGPGLSGYFPKHNYTRVVEDESTYDYPAPDAKGPPTRKPFSNLSPVDAHDVNANEPPFRTPSQEDVSNTKTNGNSPPKNSDRNGFSAEEWHEHFDNHADMFKPTDIPSRDRQSPSKNSRARAGSSRSYAQTKEKRRDAIDAEIDPITAGMRHVDSNKADAFQPPKLAPDFVDQVNSGRRASRSTQAETQNGNAYENGHANGRLATDDMDLDSPSTGPSSATDSEHYNVTVEEEHSPRVKPQDAPQQSSNRHTSDAGARGNGFSMDELKNAGPFAPSQTGLKDLNDLSNSLPFKSRPAENIDTLHRTNSTAMRDLNLPRPPKTPHCPADNEITSDTWQKFAESMTNYMHDWNKFNAAMVEHFRLRQEAVTHGMYRNWLVAWGDGASAEDFEASHGSDRAGYATYMTWLEDDKRCRAWWDVAFEEHIRCMEGLGRVRKCVKAINTAQEAAK